MNSEQKYSVGHKQIRQLLNFVESGEIAIPEIQRPFVWDAAQVRDLVDSLYRGFPVGYIITWQNPDVKLKDGSKAAGKKILIDGQQRVTALTAAILGKTVKNIDYEDVRIQIAFNPLEKRFEVFNAAIAKDNRWLKDISPFLKEEISPFKICKQYIENNPNVDEEELHKILEGLKNITNKEIGIIQLDGNLDIDAVTEIFIRINSKGVVLNQADFVMSKIAANEEYGGNMLRKCIDHFCHLAVKPEFFGKLKENDKEFVNSEYFPAISWLRNENDAIFDPSYVDMLRVAFTYKFSRGKLGDLVSLLSGRNFETRNFEEQIVESTYESLREGVLDFINETNFKRYIMIVRSAGFCHEKMLRSQSVLNFGYIIFLKLRSIGFPAEKMETLARRWIAMSILTRRYSGNSEGQFEYDIRQIESGNPADYLNDIETARLSDTFWELELPQNLEAALTTSPEFNLFLAAQCKMNARGFLSTHITVKDLIEQHGDVHHIFPRQYLKEHGLARGMYNQVANYVYTQSEINIKIGKKAPDDYLGYVANHQCTGEDTKYGGITSPDDLRRNFEENCVPPDTPSMNISSYKNFLAERRKLMAARLKEYYFSL